MSNSIAGKKPEIHLVDSEADALSELAMAAGGRAIPLAVAGAFHTSIMKPADEALAEGKKLLDFLVKNSKISNSKRGVAVVNGTAALQIALKLVGVAQGDEVITQALTFVATTNAIKYAGAEPIFIDVD